MEIYFSGTWGTITDSEWSSDDAQVACRKLGYFKPGIEKQLNFIQSCFFTRLHRKCAYLHSVLRPLRTSLVDMWYNGLNYDIQCGQLQQYLSSSCKCTHCQDAGSGHLIKTVLCKNGRVILKLLWLSELHLFGVSHDCSAFAVLDHQFWKQNVAIRISM